MLKNNSFYSLWFARVAIGFVFLVNLTCALEFLLQPERYAPGFELTGLPGRLVVQAFGVLFLMWNATYPPVLFRPATQRILFRVILAQQALGLAGETGLWWQLPSGHPNLAATGLRFILFDGFGLILMSMAYIFAHPFQSVKSVDESP